MQNLPQTSDFVHFKERLIPGPMMYVILLLILPAVTLMLFPLNRFIAVPAAITVYVLVAGFLTLTAPMIIVTASELRAGSARIPLAQLGEITTLNDATLRSTIGPGLDARAFLLVRGYIHRGIRVEIIDAGDPTPYWVVTTRKPGELTSAIDSARNRLAVG